MNVATGSIADLDINIINLMHQFRHAVFVKRLGWSLPSANDRERDKYDTSDAKYVVVLDDSAQVTASARLLPTTSQYMLPELFPQLLAGTPAPRGHDIWELSRFATSVRETRDGRVLALSEQSLELLDRVFELAQEHGVTRLIFVTSIGIERLVLRAGLSSYRLGPPAMVDGNLCVALIIEVAPRECTDGTAEDVEHAPEKAS